MSASELVAELEAEQARRRMVWHEPPSAGVQWSKWAGPAPGPSAPRAALDRGGLASVAERHPDTVVGYAAGQWLEVYHWTLSLGLNDHNARLAAAEAFDKSRPSWKIDPRRRMLT